MVSLLQFSKKIPHPCCLRGSWHPFARSFQMSQQRVFPLRKYFIPGCIGRGSGWDLRVRPAPAASGNLRLCLLGIEVEKHGFRTAWPITRQEFQGVGLKLKAFILTVRDLSSYVYQKIISYSSHKLWSLKTIWENHLFSTPNSFKILCVIYF